MPSRQTQKSNSKSQSKSSTTSQYNTNNHGRKENHISRIPVETLTGITSYLEPPSLIALSRVNKQLLEHVKDDSTWHRAFAYQVLGIGPENDLHDTTKTIMLRRSERSWKHEFVARYNLIKRWKWSRNVTTTHDPLHTAISSVHLMHLHSILASSIEYGIVSRSYPLTGKVLSGYLDASGFRTGLGIGNPNTEFSPDVSACALASEGGTAKVLWGYKGGDVAITTASKAMDVRKRTAAELTRCQVVDAHAREVLDVVWGDAQSRAFASASADGRVKLWDAKDVSCLWTSSLGSLVPDACVKVALAPAKGYIVGVMQSGEIHVWTGFTLLTLDNAAINEIVIPCPAQTGDTGTHEVSSLFVEDTASSPTILVAYRDEAYFYRVRIGKNVSETEITTFGDASFGPVSIITPFFSYEPNESSFIISGDHIGCVSVYDWSVSAHTDMAILPIRKLEAHEDGSSVTAIACNGTTLITGSHRGVTQVWDALTFEPLRHFSSPVAKLRGRNVDADIRDREKVNQILIGPEKDVLFVAVGDRIMAWKAGSVLKGYSGGVRGRHSNGFTCGKTNKTGAGKPLQRKEINQMIMESRDVASNERKRVQRVYGREKEQQAGLNNLGLSESEAVEYVLMLSRDEVNNNSNIIGGGSGSSSQVSATVDGIFEGDFDELLASPSTRPSAILSPSSPLPGSSEVTMTPHGRPIPRTLPSPSHNEIRVSPPSKENTDAGSASQDAGFGSSASSLNHFPPISPSTGQVACPVLDPAESNKTPNPVSDGEASVIHRAGSSSSSVAGRPQPLARKSAWKAPLLKKSPPAKSPVLEHPRSNNSGTGSGDDMDADLRLAIELSLVEAEAAEGKLRG